MPESVAPRRTCKACPDSLPGTAKPGGCSSLLASRPYFLALIVAVSTAPCAARLHLIRASPARSCRPLYVSHMPVRGVSVSRAYISPKKPCLQANFRVLLGFLPFFWNEAKAWLVQISICCGMLQKQHN